MTLEEPGFAIEKRAVSTDCLSELSRQLDFAKPGVRHFRSGYMASLVESGTLADLAQQYAKRFVRPVRMILFDKTGSMNWSLGWHQDRTIAVKEKHPVKGYGVWSRKDGVIHVEPPEEILRQMLTLRLDLDGANEQNGALQVISGSHKLGRLPDAETRDVVRNGEALTLSVEAGDVTVLSSLIVHRSLTSRLDSQRRVIQVDYAPDILPAPLEWAYRLGSEVEEAA